MRIRKLCLPWLVAGVLLAACSPPPIPAPLPEIITPEAPISTEAPAITATAPRLGSPTAEPTPTLTYRLAEAPEWCGDIPQHRESRTQGMLRVGLVKENDVWVWDEGKGSTKLTQHGDVGQIYLSDDGQVAAYTRPAEGGMVELWMVDVIGRKPEILLTAEEFDSMRNERGRLGVIPYNMDWVPGTHTLAFNTYPVVRGEGIWIYIPDDVRTVDVETKQLTSIFEIGSGGHFSYSPDGKRMAVFTPDSFSVSNSDGTDIEEDLLEEYRAIEYGEYYSYPWPQWASDSQKLLVTLPADSDPLRLDAQVDVWEVRMDGSEPALIKSFIAYLSEAVISPDLDKIAYWSQPDQRSSGRELRITEVYGEEDVTFAQGNVMERFEWLPDSQHFLFWYSDTWDPWLGNVCNVAVMLTTMEIRSDIQWVNETQYLYLSGSEGAWDLYLGDLEGEQTLLENLGESYSFAFALMP